MKTPPLKPCPFCKGKPKRMSATYNDNYDYKQQAWQKLHWYRVKCQDCGIEQPKRKYHSREESDQAWNDRI